MFFITYFYVLCFSFFRQKHEKKCIKTMNYLAASQYLPSKIENYTTNPPLMPNTWPVIKEA